MKKTTKEFLIWIALFIALLLIPALIWYLTERGLDSYVSDYADDYRERYGIVSQTDEPIEEDQQDVVGIIDAVSPGDVYLD